jgi:hypothetical protein
VENFLPYIA